jgi:hypothetical protein
VVETLLKPTSECENISYSKEVRERANSPGPWSLYLFSRLEHPVIRRQIEALIFEAVRGRYSKENIAREYDKRLANIKSCTWVSFRAGRSHTSEGLSPGEIIFPRAVRRDTGKIYTGKELHITESHEKGHVMRFEYTEEWIPPFSVSSRTEYVLARFFRAAFDPVSVEFPEEEYRQYRARNPASSKKSDWEIRKRWIEYLSSPFEIAERMSQLKNYFGFCGDEIFTREHLLYAREHYLQDTDYDNAMTPFFASIPPEKEEAFLQLMNSAGI